MILAGQIIGWFAVIFAFISYQCKEHKTVLTVQTLLSASLCISYLLLGAYSGLLLNIICILRNFIIYKKNLKIFSYSFWPYVLAGVMIAAGAVTWQGPVSLLLIVALAVNTLFLYFPNVQNLRRSIIVTSTLVLLYDIYFSAYGAAVNEVIAITSSIIGLYRYRTKRPDKEKNNA